MLSTIKVSPQVAISIKGLANHLSKSTGYHVSAGEVTARAVAALEKELSITSSIPTQTCLIPAVTPCAENDLPLAPGVKPHVPMATSATVASLSDFDVFWKAWPKKVAIAQARTTWIKLAQANRLPRLDVILNAIAWQRKSGALSVDVAFIPYPSSWLNAEQWMDEQPQATTQYERDTNQVERVLAMAKGMAGNK